MARRMSRAVVFLAAFASAAAFLPPAGTNRAMRTRGVSSSGLHTARTTSVLLRMAADDDGQKTSFFSKDKLLTEAATPFRTFRLFIYGGFGASALIGGLTAITQLAASLSGQPNALPLPQCITNVAVDLGVVVTCILAYRFETVQQQEMQEQKKAARLQAKQRKEAAVPEEVNERRVSQLMELRLAVNVAKDTKRAGNVKELMNVAKQDLVILGGESKFLSDAMIAAMVNRNILTSNNLLVVPVPLSSGGFVTDTGGGKGFGGKPPYLEQAFVAEPEDVEQWKYLMDEEVAFAERQGVKNARKQGVCLVVNRSGQILRRGLGRPKWELIVGDLYPELAKTDDK